MFQISSFLAGAAYMFGEAINYTYLAEYAESTKRNPTEVANLYAIMGELTFNMIYSITCYPGGRKLQYIPSISEIQSQTWYHCVQCDNYILLRHV